MAEVLRELYDKQADEFASFADTSYSWQHVERPAFDTLVSDLESDQVTVLDIGSGTGRVVDHLAKSGIKPEHMVGLDTSSRLIAIARSRLPSFNFVHGDALALPFKPASFDLITSNMVIHAFDTDELDVLFNAAYDLLKPHGIFL